LSQILPFWLISIYTYNNDIMKSKNLSQKIINIIKPWEGYEDFDGTDMEFCSKYQDPVLMRAIRRRVDIDVVESLIQAGANVNCIIEDEDGDDDSYTPLIFVCMCWEYGYFVETLLKADADVNLALRNGRTAISYLDNDSIIYIDILEMLINAGADVNNYGGYALQRAIGESNLEAVKRLVNAGAKIDIQEPDDGRTALMSLLDGEGVDFENKEIWEIFSLFCKYIGDVNVRDNNGKSLISYACNTYRGVDDFGLLALDRILFNENFDVNLTDRNQNTALITLLLEIEEAESCSLDDVKYQIESLLIAGSNVEVRNADGDSPKIIAKRIGNDEIQSLIENRVDLDNSEDRKIIANRISYEDMDFLCGYSGINSGIICKRISYEGIQSIIENRVNTENRDGEMPLFTASWYGQAKKVKWLIEKGAYINTKKSHKFTNRGYEKTANPKLKTALIVARNVKTVRELIRAGADIDVQDSDGNTALMVAECIEIAKELIRAGANMNVQNLDGNTALMLYTKANWFEGVEGLISAGADPDLTNKWFETALTIAKRNSHGIKLENYLYENTAWKFIPFILSTLFWPFKSEH